MTDEQKQQLLQRVKDEVARKMEFKDYEQMYLTRARSYGLKEFEIDQIATIYGDELLRESEEKYSKLLKDLPNAPKQ